MARCRVRRTSKGWHSSLSRFSSRQQSLPLPWLLPPSASSDAQPMPADKEERQTMAIGGALGTIAAKWLSFLAIFAVIGVVAFKFGVLRRMGVGDADTFGQIASTNAAALGMGASAVVLLAARSSWRAKAVRCRTSR